MSTSGTDKIERKRKITTAMLLLPATAWYAVLLLMPLVFIIVFSFGERGPAGGYVPAFTLENYMNLPTRSKAFLNTLTLAPIGTIACLLIAFPLAYYLALVVKSGIGTCCWFWLLFRSGPACLCGHMRGYLSSAGKVCQNYWEHSGLRASV